ncbi:MAG: isoprenyl transferase [Clostridia bacterium]|nr:isoprenyl transferase [Clostridia bacterium]
MLPFSKLFKNKKNEYNLDKDRLPVHIAIIPDGNGRWAKSRGLPRSAGHKEGSKTLKNIVIYSNNIGVKYLTVYVFSTENWRRPQDEVEALMSLLLGFLKNAEKELRGTEVKIRVIGNVKALAGDLQSEINRVEKLTQNNKGLCLNIALNYGGRDEIISSVKKIAKEVAEGKLGIESIDGNMISNKLYTAGIPDPDLLIRTSGEQRSSNFLLWQTAYTEYWYTDVLWPDFRQKNMDEAIYNFQKRNRRFGGV